MTVTTTLAVMPQNVSVFIDRISQLPVRDWLKARDSVDGMGPTIAWAVEVAEKAVDVHGLRGD